MGFVCVVGGGGVVNTKCVDLRHFVALLFLLLLFIKLLKTIMEKLIYGEGEGERGVELVAYTIIMSVVI